ncbi:hypothetical protein LV457_02725 [Mycobacterium sp. MYCO198283]|uniref:hypothetical protein n=1 Tax=Mycobacterium sp. MYCO198283 TaxID=2883505 RepID=UPI001E454274|nr:hypothetical protein [Mycobacterium sp. MYCO198283]MCG5431204.1 hypothetical protein [Mycobacterium sp. MYCO198283]
MPHPCQIVEDGDTQRVGILSDSGELVEVTLTREDNRLVVTLPPAAADRVAIRVTNAHSGESP